MEAFTWCKELWTPKTFNKFSFLVNVLWIAVGIVLFGVFLDMEINESRFDFRCDMNKNAKVDKDFIRLECFVEYEKLHNKLSVPLYGFVIVNFSLPLIVCVIYSIIATPIVNKLERRNTDVEGQNHQVNTGVRQTQTADLQTADLQTCRPADLQTCRHVRNSRRGDNCPRRDLAIPRRHSSNSRAY